MRIVFVATIPETLDLFMRGQLHWIQAQGHEVHAVSSPGSALSALSERENVAIHPIAMHREISLLDDMRALRNIVRLFAALQPDVVVAGTPKAGLLGMLAAALARVPRRVYLLRGARFECEKGARGAMLRSVERLASRSAQTVIAVSQSLSLLVEDAGVVPKAKLTTVGAGSSNGVDLARFRPPSQEQRRRARDHWRINEEQVAVLFLGRLNKDKGLATLRDAWRVVQRDAQLPILLLLAGLDEGAGALLSEFGEGQVRLLGHVQEVESLLHAADIFALPTQREGFPNAVLEASASALPVVTTDATGAVDSVLHGVTGVVVKSGNGDEFGRALVDLANQPTARERMGASGRHWVEKNFSNKVVWRGMLNAYIGKGVPKG